jgi:hypothetical protein
MPSMPAAAVGPPVAAPFRIDTASPPTLVESAVTDELEGSTTGGRDGWSRLVWEPAMVTFEVVLMDVTLVASRRVLS